MNTIEAHNLWKQTLSFFEDRHITANDSILAALSGGPDSTALVTVLHELRRRIPFRLACAYVDHGLREERELQAEREHTRATASGIDCALYVKSVPPGLLRKYASAHGCGIEAAARRFRYGFLRRVADKHSFHYIAFGHTFDDQIETVMTRFFQGSGAEGLSGISGWGTGLLRPFLTIRKEEILDFCRQNGISYITDSTNSSIDYQRNALRNIIAPAVEQVFPNYRKGIASFREKMEETAEFIRIETEKKITWTPIPAGQGGGARTDYLKFTNTHRLVRKQALYLCINKLSGGKDRRVPGRFVDDLDGRICKKMNNGPVAEGYGCRFSRYGNTLFAEPDIVFPKKKGYLVVVRAEETDLIYQSGFQIQKTLLSSTMGKDVWLYDYKEMYPLLIRSWRSGDCIAGKNGRKEVRKLFQEWNVPDRLKWEVPIIEDSAGIRAVFGSFLGFQDRYRTSLRDNTKTDTNKVLVFSYNVRMVRTCEYTEQ
jgi:tRNA(Ile)-lysidine synthetase-like protein